MNRLWIAGLAAAALLGWSEQANAQQFGSYTRPSTSPYYRPPVSPYINLGNSGSTGINYFGIVRPQQEAYSTFQHLQHQVESPLFGSALTDPHQVLHGGNPRDPQQPLQAPSTSITGHAVQFYNYGHYYSFQRRQSGQ